MKNRKSGKFFINHVFFSEKIFFKIFCYKNSKKKEKILKKFLSGRSSKSIPLSIFLEEKKEKT
jgi:hypothetical protein